MFRDLFVPLTDAPTDAAALDAAAALAQAFEARVAALAVVPLFQPPAFEWGAMPGDLYAALHDETRRQADALAEAARARMSGSEVPFEMRVEETQAVPAARIAALHARYADLVVFAAPLDDPGRRNAEALFLDLLLDGGRPVLRMPPGGEARDLPPRRVVVAWQPTREAARAVHDALPLLRRAERVEVVCVDPRVDEHRHGEQPGADIAQHLAHHGCRVEVSTPASHGAAPAMVLLRHAASIDAGLIVAGGFGHSRLRQQWLGGFTRALCEQTALPVLFAH